MRYIRPYSLHCVLAVSQTKWSNFNQSINQSFKLNFYPFNTNINLTPLSSIQVYFRRFAHARILIWNEIVGIVWSAWHYLLLWFCNYEQNEVVQSYSVNGCVWILLQDNVQLLSLREVFLKNKLCHLALTGDILHVRRRQFVLILFK